MTDQADLFAQFSNALATRAEAAKNMIVAIRLAHERHITGMVWRSEIVVVSEQSLPRKDDFEIIAAGGSVLTAKIAGRDPGTNIATLRLAESIASPSIAAGEAHTGAVALAIGADGTGGVSARLGIFALPAAKRAGPFSTPLALVSACRPSGHAARSLSFRPQPSNASYRCCSGMAASRAGG